MEEILKYPVITISRGQVLYFARTADELTTCSAVGLKNGYYNNLKIIDSSGKRFLVQRAEKIGTVGPFWGLSFSKGQRLRVKLYFSNKQEEIPLQEFKELILNALNKDEYFWDSDGELAARKVFIQSSKSHGTIISRMTDDFYEEH